MDLSKTVKFYKPTIMDLISLELPLNTTVSPDGSKIAYTVRFTNWEKNQFEIYSYIYDVSQERSFQLTRTGVVLQLHWIDDNTLASLKVDPGVRINPQVWIYEDLKGEGIQITDHKTGVQFFKPFAGGILFLADNPEKREKKARIDEYGSFVHFEQEESASTLYYTNIEKMKEYKEKVKQQNEKTKIVEPVVELSNRLGKPLKIVSFVCSPLNDAIFLNCQSKDYEIYRYDTSQYRIQLNPDEVLEESMKKSEDKDFSYMGELTRICLPKGASITDISPDGTKLLIRHKERDNMAYTQYDLWILDLTQVEEILEDEALATHMKKIAQNLDREIRPGVKWVEEGIFVSYVDGTKLRIAKIAESGDIQVLDFKDIYPLLNFDISKGGFITIIGTSEKTIPEIYVSTKPISSPSWKLKQLTSFGKKVENWDFGTVETIRWKSKDGTEIEGILRKPLNFDPDKKYPLLFRLRGGPRSYSSEFLLESVDRQLYPSIQFVHKDVLVVKPNHRGSYGYGQAFSDLQKDNLGVGELWDLEGAIEYLDSLGFIDTTRVGCMGWSYGGYVSAFAGIHSDKFCAVSVGAGCSNNYNYYVTRDNPQVMAHYLSGSPFINRVNYVKTAPISKIKQAKTPMLIQHGARDRAVALYNAKELYRGLKDMNVPVELFIYPDMGHSISRPRELRTEMLQNLTWFSHYLLGERLEFPGART